MKYISLLTLLLTVLLTVPAQAQSAKPPAPAWGTALHIQGRTAFGNTTTIDYPWLGMQVDQTYSGNSTYRGERVYLHQTASNPNALIAFDAACYWEGSASQLLRDCRGGDFSAIKRGTGTAERLTAMNLNIAVEAGGRVGTAALLQSYNIAFPNRGVSVTVDKAVGAIVGVQKAGPGKDSATINTGIGLEILSVEGNQTWAIKQDDPHNPSEFMGTVYARRGLILDTTVAQPACSVDLRGTLWFVNGASGQKDTVQVCAKDASDKYAWRTLY